MDAKYIIINALSLIANLVIFIASVLLLTRKGKTEAVLLTIGSGIELLRSVFFTFFYSAMIRSGFNDGTGKIIDAISYGSMLGYFIFAAGFVMLVFNQTNRSK